MVKAETCDLVRAEYQEQTKRWKAKLIWTKMRTIIAEWDVKEISFSGCDGHLDNNVPGEVLQISLTPTMQGYKLSVLVEHDTLYVTQYKEE